MAGTAMGTLGYMAPEVLNGGVVDERADIFAIGIMVVETLVGVRLAVRIRTDPHGPAADWNIICREIGGDPRRRRCRAAVSREGSAGSYRISGAVGEG